MLTGWSEACERNKEPILAVLRQFIAPGDRVLEIGAGTGQHAVHFSAGLPEALWQPTDRPGHLEHVAARAHEAALPNLLPPLGLDLLDGPWPEGPFQALLAANVIHIAPWEATAALFKGAAGVLTPGGQVTLYGPYRYLSRALEPSNAQFDAWLRARDPLSGVRTFEEVDAIAQAQGFALVEDRAMPANNRMIRWRLG